MVLVSHKYKFIYIKNYKVAGTSVEALFEKYCVEDEDAHVTRHGRCEYISDAGIIGPRLDLSKPMTQEVRTATWRMHKPAREIKVDLGDATFNSYYKFCVVRNPWDVAVSSYYFKNKLAMLDCNNPHHDSFQAFTKQLKFNTYRNWYIYTVDNKPVCDYYIRYENLKDDIINVATHLKLPNFNIDDLPTFKSGFRKVKDYKTLYKPGDVKNVYDFNTDEIDYFKYTFH